MLQSQGSSRFLNQHSRALLRQACYACFRGDSVCVLLLDNGCGVQGAWVGAPMDRGLLVPCPTGVNVGIDVHYRGQQKEGPARGAGGGHAALAAN
jgi:hypothetical protein